MSLFVLRAGYSVETTATGGRVVHNRTRDALELSASEVQILARAAASGVDGQEPGLRPIVKKLAGLGVLEMSVEPAAPPEKVAPEAPLSLVPDQVVPLLRSDLQLERAERGPATVVDPATGRSAMLHEFEVSLARMLNGRRKVSDVLAGAQRLGIPASLESLSQFVRQLDGYGFLEPAGSAAPDLLEGTTWTPREKWDDGSRVLFQTGLRLARRGRRAEASRYFQALLTKDPDNEAARQWLQELGKQEPVPQAPAEAPVPVQPEWLESPDAARLAQPAGSAPAARDVPEASTQGGYEVAPMAEDGAADPVLFAQDGSADSSEGVSPDTSPERLAWMPDAVDGTFELFDASNPSAVGEPGGVSGLADDGSQLFTESELEVDPLEEGSSEVDPLPESIPVELADDPLRLSAEPPPSAPAEVAAPPAPSAEASSDLLELESDAGCLSFPGPHAVRAAGVRRASPRLAAHPRSLRRRPGTCRRSARASRRCVDRHDAHRPPRARPRRPGRSRRRAFRRRAPGDRRTGASPPSFCRCERGGGGGEDPEPARPVPVPPPPARAAPAGPSVFVALGIGAVVLALAGVGAWRLGLIAPRKPQAAAKADAKIAPEPSPSPLAPAVAGDVAPMGAGPATGNAEAGKAEPATAEAAAAPSPQASAAPGPADKAAPAAAEASPGKAAEAAAPVAERQWSPVRIVKRGRVTMGEIKAPAAGTVSWQAQPQQRIRAGQAVGQLRGPDDTVALKAPKAGLLMPAVADKGKCAAGDKLAAVVYHEAYIIAAAREVKPGEDWECRLSDDKLEQREPCHVVVVAPAAGGWAVTATTAALWIDTAPSPRMELAPPAR